MMQTVSIHSVHSVCTKSVFIRVHLWLKVSFLCIFALKSAGRGLWRLPWQGLILFERNRRWKASKGSETK